MLEIMKLLWSGEMVDFKGHFFNFNKLEMLPAPKTDIPIYVGGFSEPALNRAAKHDGWISDMHSLSELEVLMAKLNGKRQEFPSKENYEYICFSCWDAFSLEGFGQMKDLGVTTMTTYPWMLYGTMNDAPLEQKLEGMEKFYNDFMKVVRLVKNSDFKSVEHLVKHSGKGMTTMPKTPKEIKERIAWSEKSRNKKT